MQETKTSLDIPEDRIREDLAKFNMQEFGSRLRMCCVMVCWAGGINVA